MAESTDYFQCQKCGECCKGYGGVFVSEREIERISKYLGTDAEDFVSDYCHRSGGKPLIKTSGSGYCIFWDKVCTIHPVKPRMCKIWPFIESMLVDPTNWAVIRSVCPGIQSDVTPGRLSQFVREALAEYEEQHET